MHGTVPPDAFAPLGDAERDPGASSLATGDDDVLDVMPCPEHDPPRGAFRHRTHGEPSVVWLYRTTDAAIVAAAARYDGTAPDGTPRKDVLPWCHGRRRWTDRAGKARDRTGWHCKAPPTPRPIYGLDRLAARPDAPVLVTEGEKAADAAALFFPDAVCITSQGGAKAAGKADWTPLGGRDVTVWPDNDTAGADYAVQVADLAKQAGAAAVQIVDVPGDWPEGWDLADTLPDNVLSTDLNALLHNAPDGTAPVLPHGFRMTSRGLLFCSDPTDNDADTPPVWIAAPFRVLGETRSDTGDAWGVLLEWRDHEGRPHRWAIPRGLIHRQGNDIAEQLEHAGLSCAPDAKAHGLLKRFIGGVHPTRRLRCVSRTGWHATETGAVFVLPGGEAFGPGSATIILQAEHPGGDAAYCQAGNLADWQRDVAVLAVGNDRLVVFLAAAFAGPLLDILGDPSGGLHLVGASRTGKTTLILVAASVWGKPTTDAQVRSWRGTANGLEATATDTTDTLLVLDEMGQADPREVGDVTYMLANESGKQRASRTGIARRRHTWRVLYLSTGEVTLAQKMGEAGKRAMAGLDVRLVSLTADAGAGLGVFQVLHGMTDAAALAEALKSAALRMHGTAGRAFLAKLAQDRADHAVELRDTLAELRDGFLRECVPAGANGQVRSVAGRFAMIAAAGELARDYCVLPWPEGEAMRAAKACFAAWLAERGGAGSGEDNAALAQVRGFFEAHGESRFTLLTPPVGEDEDHAAPELTRTINRAGFRRRVSEGEAGSDGRDAERWEFLVLPVTWTTEICKGIDPKRTADFLARNRLLTPGADGKRAASVSIRGEGKRRVYRISGAILADDGTEGGPDGAG